MHKDQEFQFQPKRNEILGNDRPFRVGIFGSSGMGKSQLIKNIMLDDKWGVRQKFKPNHVFILCPTLYIDGAYEDIIADLNQRSTKDNMFKEPDQVFHKDLQSTLNSLYEQLSKKNGNRKQEQEKQEQYLIIMDDVLLEIDLSTAHSQVAKMLVKQRHYNISTILSTQYLKSTHPIARSQLTHCFFFQSSNKKEVEKIKDECSGNLTTKQFYEIYEYCCSKPFHYLLCIMGYPVSWRFFSGSANGLQQLEV